MSVRIQLVQVSVAILTFGLGLAPDARAQVAVGAELEIGTLFASEPAGTLSSFSPIAGLSLGFGPSFGLRFRLPVVVAHFSNIGAIAAIGNPEVAFNTGLGPETLRAETRLSFTIPAAQSNGDNEHARGFWRIARGSAAAARGLYEPQLWIESSGSIRGGLSLRARQGAIFGAVHADLGATVGNADARLIAQSAVEVGVRPTNWFEIELRIQVVGLTKAEGGPRIICIARTAEECMTQPGSLDREVQLFENGRRALTADVFLVSFVPRVRFLLPPVELSAGLNLSLNDLVGIGANGAPGPGFLIGATIR